MLNTKLVTWALAVWAAVTFVVGVIYGLVTPKSIHMSVFLADRAGSGFCCYRHPGLLPIV
jgi:hypothetical protein